MKLRHWIVTAFILLLAVSSLAGTIRFKRGSTVPTSGEKGEPLWQTQGGFNGKGQLWIGYSTSQGRTAYKAYSAYIPVFGRDYADGRTISTIQANISGGVNINYDAAGINPSPSTIPVRAQLWVNGVRNTQLPAENPRKSMVRYVWSASGLITGAKTSGGFVNLTTTSQFSPTIQGTYDGSAQSQLKLYAYYSTSAGYGGKRVVVVNGNPAITKIGGTGATGATGPAGLSTRKLIFDLMSSGSQTNATPFSFRPQNNYSSSYQMAVRDYAGNVRQKTSGHGYTEFLSANNAEVVRIMTDGTIMMMKNGALRLHLKNDGSAIHYRNGQAVFQIWSTGRWKGGEGYPSSTSKQIPYVTPQGFRGYTSGGGGSGGGGMSNPYTIPGASQVFRSQSGRVRFTFYSGQGMVIH